MQWLLAQQVLSGNIRFITNVNNEASYMNYWKFLNWIKDFNVVDMLSLQDQIDKFQYVFVNVETRLWQVYKEDTVELKDDKKRYDQLVKLNVEIEERSKNEIVKDNLQERLVKFKTNFQQKQGGFDFNGSGNKGNSGANRQSGNKLRFWER